MKKNTMMRLASGLLVAVLLSTCAISGTFAKYVTTASGSDTARVAKFGVEVQAVSSIFKTSYDGEDAITVLSSNTDNVIAPGTTGTAVAFTIAGAPEVDVNVAVTLGDYTRVTLPAGNYPDYTTAENDTYDAPLYQPVVWTLKKDSADVAGCVKVGLNEIENYLKNTLSNNYDVEAGAFSTINGTYELTWNWAFDVNDKADTVLGQIAGGVIDEPATGYEADESFEFSITVTQID